MQDSIDPTNNFNRFLEAYKSLINFHMWSYDTYQKDFRFFLTVEVLLVGLVFKVILDSPSVSTRSGIVLVINILFGFLITLVWASRQFRASYFAKARWVELERVEKILLNIEPDTFRYFSEVQHETKDMIENTKHGIPAIGGRLHVLPNLMRKRAALRNLVVQQLFMLLWLTGAILLALLWKNII